MQNNITDLDEIKKILKFNRIFFDDLKEYEIRLLFYEQVIKSGVKLSLKQEKDFFRCKKLKYNEELGVVQDKLKTPEELMEENKLKAKEKITTNENPLQKFSETDKEGDKLIELLDSKYPSRELPTVESKHPVIDDSSIDEIKDFENEFNDDEFEDEIETPKDKKKKFWQKKDKSKKDTTNKPVKTEKEKSGNKPPNRKRNLIILGVLLVILGALTLYNKSHGV